MKIIIITFFALIFNYTLYCQASSPEGLSDDIEALTPEFIAYQLFYIAGASEYEEEDLIEAISNIKPGQRKGVISEANQFFTKGMRVGEKATIIGDISKIKPDQRKIAINIAKLLFVKERYWYKKYPIIEKISEVLSDDDSAAKTFSGLSNHFKAISDR